MKKYSEGFTLLELLLVIAIISVLAGFIIFSLRPVKIFQDTKEAKKQTEMKSIDNALEDYVISNEGRLPSSLEGLGVGSYSICSEGEVSCPVGSVSLDELVATGNIAAIPVAPDCISANTTCFKVTIGNNSSLRIDEDNITVGAGDTLAYNYTGVLGVSSTNPGIEVQTDSMGNAYLAQILSGSNIDVDITNGTDLKSSNGLGDILLTKISPTNTYLWSYVIGGVNEDAINQIAIDNSNNLFLIGSFASANVDFDPTGGTDIKSANSNTKDIFLTKINSDGSYGWTYTIGGSSVDIGYVIDTDSNGNIYLGGSYRSANVDFDPTGGTDIKSASGENNFFTKINANGTYGWTYTMGIGHPRGIVVDSNFNIYLTGYLTTSSDMNPFAGVDTHVKDSFFYDMYVTKINSDLTYAWTYDYGAPMFSEFYGIPVLDNNDNLYVVGQFNATFDFNPLAGVDNKDTFGGYDVFLTKINVDGSYGGTQTIGGDDGDWPDAVVVDNANNIYIIGSYYSTVIDFDFTEGVDSKPAVGGLDVFLTRINADLSYGWTYVVGGDADDYGMTVNVDYLGDIHLGGFFQSSTVDFDPTAGTDLRNLSGADYDNFYSKYTTN